MDKPHLRKLQMYEAVLLYLQIKNVIWSASTTFNTEVDALNAGIIDIKEKDRINKKSNDATKGKEQKRDAMIKATSKICNAGVAYADSIDDAELRGKFDFSPKDLEEGNVEIVIARCRQIGIDAIAIVSGLTDWGMPTDYLAVQSGTVEAFELASPKAKDIVTTGKSTNKEMNSEFKVIDTHLKRRLDKLVNSYEDIAPDFVTEYYDKRYIGGRKKKVVPTVPPTPLIV
jgi:hypothetical protein